MRSMPTRVLVDANVLYSRTLRDWLFLLKLESNGGMFTVLATEDVIAETLYRLRRKNPTADGSLISSVHDRIVKNIDERISDFVIDGSFLGDDGDDAHVHAAAVAGGASIVLTDDNGWSDAIADQLPYEVHHPDSFFTLTDDSAPHVVRSVVARQVEYFCRRDGRADLPGALQRAGCFEFAERVRRHLNSEDLQLRF